MKIIHIIPNLKTGGAERLVQDICVHIYVNQLADIKLITFHKDVEIKYPFHVNIISEFKPSISSKPKKNVLELQSYIDDFNPDIIHSHLWETEMLLTNITNKDSVRFSHFHDNMIQLKKTLIPNSKDQLTNMYERKLFLKNMDNHFISIAKNSFLYAQKNLSNKLKIHLLPNAINFSKFNFVGKRDLKQIRLINIGSFIKEKNQSFAVNILKNILDRGFSASLTFLGDGELKKDVEKLSTILGINKYINFHGNVSNVKEYLIESNIYLHTATSEAFGLVILEAMAAGLPVITLDGKGNRDIVVNGENGYIFKNQDTCLFSDQIIELYEKEKLYEKISVNGQETAKMYDINNYTKKLMKLYRDSISSTNSS